MDGRPSSTRTLVSTMSSQRPAEKLCIEALQRHCARSAAGRRPASRAIAPEVMRGQIYDLSVYFVLLRSTWDVLLINAIGDIRNVHCDQTNIGGQQ